MCIPVYGIHPDVMDLKRVTESGINMSLREYILKIARADWIEETSDSNMEDRKFLLVVQKELTTKAKHWVEHSFKELYRIDLGGQEALTGYSTPIMSYTMDSDPLIGDWKSTLMAEFSQKDADKGEVEMLSEKGREEMKEVLTVRKRSLPRRNSGGKREGRHSCQVREGRVERTRGKPVNTHGRHSIVGENWRSKE